MNIPSIEEMKKKYPSELVFCISDKFTDDLPEGVHPIPGSVKIEDWLREGVFIPRYKAEYRSPGMKQIIPYVVIQYEDKFFMYKRLAGDIRIVGNVSIGVGGHINPVDDEEGRDKLIEQCIVREIDKEELIVDYDPRDIHLIGYIKDTSDLIGKDHIGLLYVLKALNPNIKVKEVESLEGELVSIDRIKEVSERKQLKMENWSKLIVETDLLNKNLAQ